MEYSKFSQNFINNVYVPYMNGDVGQSRINLTNIYREGMANPRATLYQLSSSVKDAAKFFKEATNTLKAQNNNEAVAILSKNHIAFSKEFGSPKHPVVKKVLEEIAEQMKAIYPSKRTRNLSRFVMLKEQIPFLAKMKFLARFL